MYLLLHSSMSLLMDNKYKQHHTIPVLHGAAVCLHWWQQTSVMFTDVCCAGTAQDVQPHPRCALSATLMASPVCRLKKQRSSPTHPCTSASPIPAPCLVGCCKHFGAAQQHKMHEFTAEDPQTSATMPHVRIAWDRWLASGCLGWTQENRNTGLVPS